MLKSILPLALLLTTSACSDPADANDGPDAAPTQGADAAPVADCSGDASVLVLHGALERSIAPLVYVTVSDQIKGFGSPSESVSFKTSSSALTGYLDEVGVFDVAEVDYNMVFVDYTPGDALCESEPCEGFYALSGSYEVIEHSDIYRARFGLSDLRELGAEGPGAPMTGTITGCLVVEAP